MSAFHIAADALAADANLGAAATYRVGGLGAGTQILVLRREPDVTLDWGMTAIMVGAVLFLIRAADVAAPAPGDTLTIGSTVYTVQDAAPRADVLRIWNTVIARRA